MRYSSSLFRYLFSLFSVLVIAQTGNAQNNAQALPSHFINNRIFVEPVTTQGDTLKLYTDSGGGQILSQDLVNRIHLPTEEIHPGSRTMKVVALPDFIPQADIPAPANQAVSVDAASLHHKYNIMQGRLFVKSQMPNGFGEGMLGRNWFGTRIWTFDYPSHKLLLRSSYTPPESPANHRVPIYFKENNQGKHLMHFPRITAVIGQDTLSFLFDTGATIQLNDHTEAQYVAGLKEISGGSFIIRSRFEQWHKEHPDWKIVEDAALHGADLIRVPQVTIAGYTVGPVWFATRPDRNFEQKMAQWMDRKVQGAVGGSLFQYFRITLNYPEGYAVFDQEEGS